MIEASSEASVQRRVEQVIVSVVRDLAGELSGDRAASAVTASASLERDVGLGSLERVELLTRLEGVFGRELDDRFLLLDTPREIAAAIVAAPEARGIVVPAATVPRAPVVLHLEGLTTLVEALYRRATDTPSRVHVLLDADDAVQPITYADLWDGAARIARSLTERGVTRGDTVAIMLPTSRDYLQAFMGTLAAGAIAVPLYPPARLARLTEYLDRQAGILANAGSRVMIAMPEAVPIAHLLHRAAPALETILTVDVLREGVDPITTVTRSSGDSALIQYTSGSTGDPKGVLLTHANLLANIHAIAAGVKMVSTDLAVSWLPLYHDMGLIGTWLNAMVHGIPLVLMSPLRFLARPERWLWAIHEQRATLSPAPNFAYELCVRKTADEALAGLDLSSWRCASNGSEPVSAATLDRFARRFEPYGFRRQAFFPVYGLAECAVALCFPPIGRAPLVDVVEREAFESDGRAVPAPSGAVSPLTFVSVGAPLPEHEVRLVDEANGDVADRVVGRLLFRGPSCMAGYFRNAQATERATQSGGWIDSGDLAYRAGEELFITGRVKDLVIKGGRNLVPQEIEEIAGSVDGIRKGCVAAFGIADETTGTERLVVVAESRLTSRDDRRRLERGVVAAVATELGVPPDVVCVVDPGVVPKTPSGKIRRAAAREVFERGQIASPPRVPAALRARLALAGAAQGARAAVRKTLRGLQVVYLLVAWSVVLLLLGPFVALLLFALPAGRPVRWLSRVVARVALGLSGCRLEVEGLEHLPHRGPAVLVTNHTSYADTPALVAALPIDFVFVAMREILSWHVIGALVRRGSHLTVDRWHLRQSVADTAAVEDRLRRGEIVLFFAEGGFARARGLRPFRLGAFEAAAHTDAPIVPIALRGSREILPADTRLPHPSRVHVWIGAPIQPGGHEWRDIVSLRDRAADAIAEHCGEPRLRGPVTATGANVE